MQTCDLVYEETNPEGHSLQMLRYVHSRHKYRACMAHICNFLKTELRGLRSFPLCPQIVCINNCITIIPFVRSLSSRGSFRCISLFHWTDAKSYGMVAYVQQPVAFKMVQKLRWRWWWWWWWWRSWYCYQHNHNINDNQHHNTKHPGPAYSWPLWYCLPRMTVPVILNAFDFFINSRLHRLQRKNTQL